MDDSAAQAAMAIGRLRNGRRSGGFSERNRKDFTADEIRFTTLGGNFDGVAREAGGGQAAGHQHHGDAVQGKVDAE